MREGLIPTALGTVVTGVAFASRVSDMKKGHVKKRHIGSMISTGLLGFGLAHIVLGGIDLIQDR